MNLKNTREETMEKKIRIRLLAGAFIGALVAHAPASAQQRLTIYSAYENSQIAPLTKAFEAKNPGAAVDHFRQPGEELLATIELELRARSPKADVVGLNDASIAYLQKRHDAFEPYAAKDADKARVEMRSPQNIFTPAFVNLYLIHYNTRRISEADVPKSWADLADPKWKNQIAMADPSSSQSVQSFVWFIADYLVKSDPAKFGWDYFKRMGANGVHLESSHGTIRDLTVSGERPIGINLLANAQTAKNRGEPTSNIWPSEGVPGELSAFGLLRASKNKELGKRWLDFIISPEGQGLMPASLGGAPVRNDVAYKYPDGSSLEQVKIIPVDSTFISDNKRTQARKFHDAVGK
jgi:iron(III) transport system substrate-binding protein